MRTLLSTALVLGLVSLAGCDRSTALQPEQHDVASMSSQHSAAAGKPELDPSYANGKTVYMIGPHMVVNARETMPEVYQKAEELYLLAYPQETLPAPGAGPITLPSGYQPQCDPCFHPGLPAPFVYHDHVLTGAPGMGNHGTAGEFKSPWKIIVLVYNPAYVNSTSFKPITSAADLDAAEAAGNAFLPVNTGGLNPYEIETGNLLICPLVSPHA